eukprot:3280370-Amphidinium_carterae.1
MSCLGVREGGLTQLAAYRLQPCNPLDEVQKQGNWSVERTHINSPNRGSCGRSTIELSEKRARFAMPSCCYCVPVPLVYSGNAADHGSGWALEPHQHIIQAMHLWPHRF